MYRQDRTIAYLDGIRGVAALGVFLNHFSLAFYPAWATLNRNTSHLNGLEINYTYSVFSFLNNGNLWVATFFVLSGYVLSHRYLTTGDIEVPVSGLFRRFLRLFIPITFVIILSWLLLVNKLYFNEAVGEMSRSSWYIHLWHVPHPTAALLKNILFGSSLFIGFAGFDTCLWTMPWEFYGSLFVFAFLILTHFTPRYRLLMLFLALFYFCIMQFPLYADMLLGMTLFYIEQHVKASSGKVTKYLALLLLPLGLVLGSALFCSALPGTWQEAVTSKVWDYTPWVPGIAAYCMILAFVVSPRLQRIAGMKVFAFLGYISFALYLLHPIILGSFTSWLFLKLYHGANYNQAVLISFLAMIPVLIVASWLMSRYIDQFGIRLAKRLYGYVRKPAGEEKVEA